MSDTTIIANVSSMFSHLDPWDCSNSIANLGENAPRITWGNALSIADRHPKWLLSDVADACEGMRDWARDTGAWERDEIAAWSERECLALLVQNVARDLRLLGSDQDTLEDCAARYASTNWEQEADYPTGSYYAAAHGDVRVDYYTGC